MTTFIFTFLVLLVFVIYNLRKPMKYRVVRSPGDKSWHIEWKQGIFHGTEKEYIGGGLSGFPIYNTEYFPTKTKAMEHLYSILEKKKDEGEKTGWMP